MQCRPRTFTQKTLKLAAIVVTQAGIIWDIVLEQALIIMHRPTRFVYLRVVLKKSESIYPINSRLEDQLRLLIIFLLMRLNRKLNISSLMFRRAVQSFWLIN